MQKIYCGGYLKAKPLGYKFRRQHPYAVYILDFYCHALKLAIEVDGNVHEKEEMKRNDELRQQVVEQEGITVLRFTNEAIVSKLESVISQIEQHIAKNE